ncbi:hypothetical protein [Actinomadura kijaniata]|uniref:hypothetical protein n=1 Tax=Actinomadura kijaniata TaxID=46161 RepID=UPI0008308559|nr:hypothetical protein [Actinomadura kijaniata]
MAPSRYNSDFSRTRQQADHRLRKWMTEPSPRHPSSKPPANSGSPSVLLALALLAGGVLAIAALLGYSPAEMGEWGRDQVEAFTHDWLDA